jgi:hypothetical protein
MTRARIATLAFACGLALASLAAQARDEVYDSLAARYEQLAADPALAGRAPGAFERARAALAQLKQARRGERDHWAAIAGQRIDTAQASAQAERLGEQEARLQRENDRLQLLQARREAEQARAELERQRLQAQIRAEEAERARRDAEQARAEGEQAAQAAEAARAEAAQAKRLAEAQAKANALARKEAELEAAVGGKKKPAGKPKPKAKPRAKASQSPR